MRSPETCHVSRWSGAGSVVLEIEAGVPKRSGGKLGIKTAPKYTEY